MKDELITQRTLQDYTELFKFSTRPKFKKQNTKTDNKLNFYIPEKWDYNIDI